MANAAAFAAALAAVLASHRWGPASHLPGPALAAPRHSGPTNIAMGDAHVGVQGENVTVHGGIQLGGSRSGSGAASFGAEADKPAIRSSTLRLALNCARGVFRGIVDLAAGVAAIMTAVRSVT